MQLSWSSFSWIAFLCFNNVSHLKLFFLYKLFLYGNLFGNIYESCQCVHILEMDVSFMLMFALNEVTHQVSQKALHQEQQRWRRAGKTKAQDFQPASFFGSKLVSSFNFSLVTCGRACMTVSNKARIPLAILSSLRTLAIRRTRMTLMMVGLMGKTWPWTSSSAMPIIDRNTIDTSSWFHLNF